MTVGSLSSTRVGPEWGTPATGSAWADAHDHDASASAPNNAKAFLCLLSLVPVWPHDDSRRAPVRALPRPERVFQASPLHHSRNHPMAAPPVVGDSSRGS